MMVIKADHARRLVIPGVPGPARRPVDIDSSQTGFTSLRTLRIYRFDAASVINGHAEEDEVFVVVLSGSVELTIGRDDSTEDTATFRLAAAGDAGSDALAAYLPPHANYRLTPLTDADVAYARATPREHRPSEVFRASESVSGANVNVLLDESAHASLLRLRLIQVDAKDGDVTVDLLKQHDALSDALAHVHCSPAEHAVKAVTINHEPLLLKAWDTLVINPGERPVLHVAKGASVSVTLVLAR